ncbi:type VI secretion system tube protein Hcp [Roseateles amylovorans]|uniref:Type VI secretion system tube protein Hcp n=1 Tax=Roseateles amylovorans TaxID=2978473 RepID=A0ABY6AV16_9BURK|nr:type VI secretion system tube protein Hcp [Roseateles amylovorans]UXH76153.1 type VI secretion system tube protein Hcp [Roseateles amylovorans]
MTQHARLYMYAVGDGGPIAGESRVPAMRDWIELEDWQWSLDADGDAGRAPEPSVLSISKRMDRSSMPLLSAMDRGMPMVVTLCMEDAAQELMSLSIKLRQARVTRYSLELRNEDASVCVMEHWELDYREAAFEYREDRRSGVTSSSVKRLVGASTASPASGGGGGAGAVSHGAGVAGTPGAAPAVASSGTAAAPREFALRDMETMWRDLQSPHSPAGSPGLKR